jgi:hypothetical protein
MYSNQSWPPVITALGVYPYFRNATRAEQWCCRDLQGHIDFLFKGEVPKVLNSYERKDYRYIIMEFIKGRMLGKASPHLAL